jgi:RNA polymerase sigma-70 factor (ECF subfamily)
MYASTQGLGTPVKVPRQTAKNIENPTTSAQEAIVDSKLVERFNSGDDAAFVEIMERYRGKIFTVTLGLLRNHADAEEITQDTFIRAHRGLNRFRGDSSLATWLYRIAVNLARNRYWYFFRRRRQDSLSLDCALGEENAGTFSDLVADVAQDPAQEAATGEFSNLINNCMAQLDARHREILTLRNVLNRSYEEIAATLGINVGTVKSRIARARENLRTLLAEACPEFSPESAPSDWFIPTRSSYGRPSIAAC